MCKGLCARAMCRPSGHVQGYVRAGGMKWRNQELLSMLCHIFCMHFRIYQECSVLCWPGPCYCVLHVPSHVLWLTYACCVFLHACHVQLLHVACCLPRVVLGVRILCVGSRYVCFYVRVLRVLILCVSPCCHTHAGSLYQNVYTHTCVLRIFERLLLDRRCCTHHPWWRLLFVVQRCRTLFERLLLGCRCCTYCPGGVFFFYVRMCLTFPSDSYRIADATHHHHPWWRLLVFY